MTQAGAGDNRHTSLDENDPSRLTAAYEGGESSDTVAFELTRADYAAGFLHIRKDSFIGRNRWWLGLVLGAAVAYLTLRRRIDFAVAAPTETRIMQAGLCLGVCVLAAVAYYAFSVGVFRWQVKRVLDLASRELLGSVRLSIHPNGITVTRPGRRTERAWSEIGQIDQLETYALLRSGRLIVLPVPARAFASRAAFDRFVDRAREYRAAAR